MPEIGPDQPPPAAQLPHGLWEALLRGVRGNCPRCGAGKLFARWLKPKDNCPACGLDLSGQRSDDFPAYIALFLTGHILAPFLIIMVLDYDLSAFAVLGIIIPVAVLMMVAMLQPAKGAVIGLQWWNGMHGFRRERRPVPDGEDAPTG